VKIGLGTVQFGVDYGISNSEGQTSVDEVVKVLAVARRHGVRIIDTAALYGSSESVLGKVLPADHQFKLVTKTARIDAARITPADVALMEQTFARSLVKLNCSSVYGLLIHNSSDLLARDGHLLMESLNLLKKRGMVSKIGVSLYSAEQVEQVLEKYEIDLVQLPINVLDQRLLQGGQLAKLKAAGVELHARSAFLQGLLLMNPDTLPAHFDSIKLHLKNYHDYLSLRGITPVQAALGFVSGLSEIDAVICGVNNHLQLEELCSNSQPLPVDLFSEFALDCVDIVNPANWRL